MSGFLRMKILNLLIWLRYYEQYICTVKHEEIIIRVQWKVYTFYDLAVGISTIRFEICMKQKKRKRRKKSLLGEETESLVLRFLRSLFHKGWTMLQENEKRKKVSFASFLSFYFSAKEKALLLLLLAYSRLLTTFPRSQGPFKCLHFFLDIQYVKDCTHNDA